MNAITNSIGMKLVDIPSGNFMMGSPENEHCYLDSEQQHEVSLSKSYYLGQTVVTQGQWERVMRTRPWMGKDFVGHGDDFPAVYVSWEHATEFCERLTELSVEQKAGRVYRLPTEAEWEYACRAGMTTAYSFGNTDTFLSDHAWFSEDPSEVGEEYAHQVAQKQPNGWGLYDMHGNVWEWCSDWYDDYPTGSVTDPTGPQSGSLRVVRGGSWDYYPEGCRSANRVREYPSSRCCSLGFRVTCVPSGR